MESGGYVDFAKPGRYNRKKPIGGNAMKHVSFANGQWREDLTTASSFRFTETPDFTQREDHVTTRKNPDHREGFDNISLLDPQRYGAGVKVQMQCAFDGLGCPEIIFVEKPEMCPDGAVRYGACFEVVLWKNGINVWRHYMDAADHRCYWHKRLGFTMPIAEGQTHVLTAEVVKDYIVFSVDGVKLQLRTEDMFEQFYVGVTACEGIVRLYDLRISQE